MRFRAKPRCAVALFCNQTPSRISTRPEPIHLRTLLAASFTTIAPARSTHGFDNGDGSSGFDQTVSRQSHGTCFSYIVDGNSRIEPIELESWAERLDLSSQDSRPVVVLSTPQQRHLLDPGPTGFIRTLISKAQKCKEIAGQQVTVITGIVDRIDAASFAQDHGRETTPGPSDDQSQISETGYGQGRLDVRETLAGAEGIAIGNTWSEALWTPGTTRSQEINPGYIRFSIHTQGGLPQDIAQYEPRSPLDPGETRSVTLSLAPTMMQTGTEFFMRRQTWTWDQDTSEPVLVANDAIESIELVQHTKDRTRRPMLWHDAPVMFPITQPRRIHSSFGNVIQTFELDSAKSGGRKTVQPASHELELNIDEFRKGLQGEGKGAEIWATVKSGQAYAAIPRTATSYVDMTENIVQQGLSMFHVHGGGGGWEGRGGPVTLDPGNSSQQQDSQGALSDEAALERYLSGADSLVKPGDVVQFYLVGLRKPWLAPGARGVRLDVQNGRPETRVMAGTLPCPADRVHSTKVERRGLPMFGVLAEQATFSVELHSAKTGYDHGSRQLGIVYRTNLPPSTSCILATV